MTILDAGAPLPKPLELEQLELPDGVAPAIDGLRLAGDTEPALFLSQIGRAKPGSLRDLEAVIRSLPPAGGPLMERFRVPLLFQVPPGWDTDGKRLALTTTSGSMSALSVLDGLPEDIADTHGPFDSFCHPRFVRGKGPAVTAVLQEGTREWQAFYRAGAKPAALGPADDGVLVEREGGYSALSKSQEAGLPKGPAVATPGHLEHRFLGPDYSLLGGEWSLADAVIYQLDAVALGPAHVAALVTTDDGATLYLLRAGPAGVKVDARRVWLGPMPSWPAVAAHDTRLVLALVAGAASPAAKVLHGQISLEELLK